MDELRGRVQAGEDFVVYDFDGPRDEDGNPVCVEVTSDVVEEKLNDPRHPFGHGYIVAALIAGLEIPTSHSH